MLWKPPCTIKSEPGQRRFGPFGGNWRFGKSLRRRESSARIYDDHLEADKACRHGERLRDIRRANCEKPYGRSLDIEKQPSAGMLDQGAAPLPQPRFDELLQWIIVGFVRADRSLFARVNVGDEHAGTPGGAFIGESFQNAGLASSPSFAPSNDRAALQSMYDGVQDQAFRGLFGRRHCGS